MKQFQLLFFALTFLTTTIFAQPPNDDCDGIIDLGVAPACQTDVIYTNIGATPSDIGAGNSPTCFNGGTTQRDVWFSFTTSSEISDYTFRVEGVENGDNTTPIRNPQIALYRGNCQVNGLAELLCQSAPNGQNAVSLNAIGLSGGITYYLRVNDYSATGAPNFGDFTLCVDELSNEINIGESTGSVACSGTLYDSGGPDGNYGGNESALFTICPQEFSQCIVLNIQEFATERNFDRLRIYAGSDNNSNNLIANLTGVIAANSFEIQASSECVTVEFLSDPLISDTGFALTWECTAEGCDGSSVTNPTVINNLPFSESTSTCGAAATFANSPCTGDEFLNGPEVVYTFDSPGGICTQVQLTDAMEGTGIAVFNGDPTDPNTECVARTAGSLLGNANMEMAGTYYIVVANASGCTDYGINIIETDCALSPALVDALCNPLNGCANDEGLPTQFIFEDGFQDLVIIPTVNGGCWTGTGLEPDFYWFTIQANADGDFGFILESADNPSDIDFNVWGPFTQNQVCDTPDEVVAFVSSEDPIRSSYSPDPIPTGMVNINPITGEAVTDEFDCASIGGIIIPGAGGDSYVTPIEAQKDEVYVVLVNDWGNEIESGGINVDFSPSDEEVLAPIPPEILTEDLSICGGESAQIEIESAVGTIEWLNDTETLSCNDCFDPIATPTQTTTYRAVIDGVCTSDTIEVSVQVFDLDAGEDATVCRGEMFVIEAGEDYPNATYTWTADEGIELSCLDCPAPMINTPNAGTFNITVELDAPNCPATDMVTITVLQEQAAIYDIKADQQICIGQSTDLMNNAPANQAYIWTSEPVGFTSSEPNPTVSPTETTLYLVAISNGICPFPSMDSILVEVADPPLVEVAEDTRICLGDTIQLSTMEAEFGVEYTWTGTPDILEPSNPQSLAIPITSGSYTLTANRNGCEVSETFNVEVVPIDLRLVAEDTTLLCLGDTIGLGAISQPAGNPITYTPQDGSFDELFDGGINAYPTDNTTYYFRTEFEECVLVDSVFVKVDSLPVDLAIMPADTTICEGMMVELTSTVYEPADFPDIDFVWRPADGALTPDSLFNLVVTPTDTTIYNRINTNGACVDTSTAIVNVNPIPNITITPMNPEICPGESVDLTTAVDQPVLIEEYEWMPVNGLSCTDCPNPTASPQVTTTYMVMGMTEDGCPAMGQVTIQVSTGPNYTFPVQNVICPGETVTLNLSPNDNFNYTWTAPDGSLNSNEPAPIVAPQQTTTYTLTISDGECPPITDQITIEVAQDGDITIEGNTNACLGDELVLTANTTAPGTVTWTEAGASSTTDRYFVNTEFAGTRIITYVYDIGPGCSIEEGAVEVSVGSPFQVDSISQSIPNPIPLGSQVDLRVFLADDIDVPKENITWGRLINGEFVPLGEEETFDGTQATVKPLEPTNYAVQLISADGCTVTETIFLDVIVPMIQIPNVFTPNGDNLNDFFYPVNLGVGTNLGNTEITTFVVYNRWGQQVYNNENPEQGWDGMYNGNPAPADAYVYRIVLTLEGEDDVREGEVLLLR